nr:hypothetical protein [Tanacetum cinerariifolium]
VGPLDADPRGQAIHRGPHRLQRARFGRLQHQDYQGRCGGSLPLSAGRGAGLYLPRGGLRQRVPALEPLSAARLPLAAARPHPDDARGAGPRLPHRREHWPELQLALDGREHRPQLQARRYLEY